MNKKNISYLFLYFTLVLLVDFSDAKNVVNKKLHYRKTSRIQKDVLVQNVNSRSINGVNQKESNCLGSMTHPGPPTIHHSTKSLLTSTTQTPSHYHPTSTPTHPVLPPIDCQQFPCGINSICIPLNQFQNESISLSINCTKSCICLFPSQFGGHPSLQCLQCPPSNAHNPHILNAFLNVGNAQCLFN